MLTGELFGEGGEKNEKADRLQKKQIVAINFLCCTWNRSLAKIVVVWAERREMFLNGVNAEKNTLLKNYTFEDYI